jgi:Effector Associated Constant Component 1
VHLSLSELGADDARLDTLTRQMGDELRQLDVVDVRLSPGGAPPPPGSRGVDAAAVGQIVVAMLGAQGLAGLISTVLGWLGRGHDAPRTVRLELDGDVLELAGASSDEQDRLVELFVTKHSGKG